MGYPGDQDGPPPWGRPSQQPWRVGEEGSSDPGSPDYPQFGGDAYGRGDDRLGRTPGAYRPHDAGRDRWGPEGSGPYGSDPRGFPHHDDEPGPERTRRIPAAGPRPDPARSRGGGRGGGKLAIGIVAALVLAGGGAGAYYMVSDREPADTGQGAAPASSTGPSASGDPSASAEPSASTAAAPAGRWRHIDKRSTDPKPLTLAEVFPARKLTVAGRSYTLTRKRLMKKCVNAVYGTKLRTALKTGGCTQVMRASFISADGKVMGTVGVANMRDTAGAERAGRVNGTHQFVQPLPGTEGPTRDIGEGIGLVQALLRGHYLVLTWTEFTNGHKPSTSERARLARFTDDIIDKTVSPAIGHRMLYGVPRT